MDTADIRKLVGSFDTKDDALRQAAWEQLRDLNESVLQYFEEFFPNAKRLEARRDIAFHCIKYARKSDVAFRIGLAAINDRSSIVRYRGCCILAYSLRVDAVAPLQLLLRHSDAKTVEDAKAAIDAIQNRNHHYFVDREHSGRVRWDVCPGDVG